MSLFEMKNRFAAQLLGVAALSAWAALSGCQVRPLYSAGVTTFSSGPSAGAMSISVNEVTSRYGQEVRNHLIFALSGGAGEPASPAYKLELGVTKRVTTVASITPATGESRGTAGAVVLASYYVLSDASTGSQVAAGSREVTASFDRPRQQFAQLRAERDAEDRAARELAEALKLAIAADLANK
jgi:LPS-assembly lipoprotein